MQIDVHDNISAVLRRFDKVKADVLEKAIPRALNRTAEMATVQASRELRAQGYAFSAGEIKAAIRLSKASRARLTVVQRVGRRVKSLMEFSARQTKAGVSVKVHGARKVIKGAFIAQLRNGRTGVYVQDKAAGKTVLRMSKTHGKGSVGGWQSFPVRKLYGPSVGGSYATERMQQVMGRFILEKFSERLAHELRFLQR